MNINTDETIAAAPAAESAKPAAKMPARTAAKAPRAAKPKAAKAETKTAAPAKAAKPVKAAAKAAAPKAAAVKPSAKPVSKAVIKKPAAKPAEKPAAVAKPAKVKLVRDSFTMPADEYATLGQLKQRALSFAHPAKKSELLRAGVKLLSGLSDAALARALKDVPAIKTGRPKSKKGD